MLEGTYAKAKRHVSLIRMVLKKVTRGLDRPTVGRDEYFRMQIKMLYIWESVCAHALSCLSEIIVNKLGLHLVVVMVYFSYIDLFFCQCILVDTCISTSVSPLTILFDVGGLAMAH